MLAKALQLYNAAYLHFRGAVHRNVNANEGSKVAQYWPAGGVRLRARKTREVLFFVVVYVFVFAYASTLRHECSTQ